MKVRGKVAIVTGAGTGIGSAVALRLAQEGAYVVVADIDEDGGSGTVREIGSEGGGAAFFRSDVASRRERERMTPEDREGLPTVTLRPEEIAGAVMMLVEDETMAGRVMIWREGEPWRLVPPDSTC